MVIAAAKEPSIPSPHSIKTCAIRTHGVIGKQDKNIVPLFATVPRGINIGPGTNLYDFTGAENVALAHVLAVESLLGHASANGRAFYVTDGRPKPMRQVMEMVWTELDKEDAEDEPQNLTNPRYPFRKIPIWLIYGILWFVNLVFRIIGKTTPISLKEIGDGVSQRYFDISVAKEILKYDPPVPLEQSIRDACHSYKKTNPNSKSRKKP